MLFALYINDSVEFGNNKMITISIYLCVTIISKCDRNSGVLTGHMFIITVLKIKMNHNRQFN